MSAQHHLGVRLSAVVDGELSHADRERVLAHLAQCADCRAAVEAERALKSRLGALHAPDVPDALLARLQQLPAPGSGLASPTGVRRPSSAGGVRRPRRSPGALQSQRVRPTRTRRVAAGTGAVLAVALSAAFAVGGDDGGARVVRPEVERFAVEHASVTGNIPLVDPASFVGAATP